MTARYELSGIICAAFLTIIKLCQPVSNTNVKQTTGSNLKFPTELNSPPKNFLNINHINDIYDVRQSARCLGKMNTYSDENTLRLFSGDIVGPSIISDIKKGMQMVKIMQEFAFDFSVLGNHEFDYQEPHFLDFNAQVDAGWKNKQRPHKWLVSNFRHKDAPKDLAGKAEPFGVREVNGQKICVFGLVDVAWMEATKLKLSDWDYEDYKAAARRVSRELRATQDCALIICLTHMENKSDETLLTDGYSAKNPDGNDIDLVLGGHDHIYYIRKIGERVLLKSGMDFEQFSNLKVWWGDKLTQTIVPNTNAEKFGFIVDEEKNGHQRNFLFSLHRPNAKGSFKYLNVLITRVTIEKTDPKDPVLADYIKNEIDPLIMKHLLPVLHIQPKLDTREKILFSGESPVMNMFADVGRAYLGTELSIVNVRMMKGEKVFHSNTFLRRLDFMRLFPYHEDKYVEVKLTGQELLTLLKEAVPLIHKEDKRWIGVSGITFRYIPPEHDEDDPHIIKVPAKLDSDSVKINGKPLNIQSEYSCAVISSLLKVKVGYSSTIGKVTTTELAMQKEPIQVFDYLSELFEKKEKEFSEEYDLFKVKLCKGFNLDKFVDVKQVSGTLADSLNSLKDKPSCLEMLNSANNDALRRARFYALADSVMSPDNRVVLSFQSFATNRLVAQKRLLLVL